MSPYLFGLAGPVGAFLVSIACVVCVKHLWKRLFCLLYRQAMANGKKRCIQPYVSARAKTSREKQARKSAPGKHAMSLLGREPGRPIAKITSERSEPPERASNSVLGLRGT